MNKKLKDEINANGKKDKWRVLASIYSCVDVLYLYYVEEEKDKNRILRCRKVSPDMWIMKYKGYRLVFGESGPDLEYLKELFQHFAKVFEGYVRECIEAKDARELKQVWF